MFSTLLLCTFLFTASVGSDIAVTELEDDIIGSWSLSHFSDMIRRTIISAVPFPWETVETALDTDTEVDMAQLAQEMITHEMPLLVPACLGLLLAILVPIITLFFCCCRCCCGCCGGKLTEQNVRNHKLHWMFINSFIIIFLVGCLSAMACCIPIGGNRLQTSPRLMLRAVNTSVDDISSFFQRFVNDTSGVAMDVLNTTVVDIKKDLDDLPDTLSEPVTDGARPIVEVIESKIFIISTEINFLGEAEADINSTVDAMIVYSNNLQIGLSNINGLYASIKANCTTAGKSYCNTLPDGTGSDALNVSIDNSKLTDISDEATTLLVEANKVNLTEYSTLGNTTFEEVPKTIKNASQDAIDAVKSTLDTVHDDMKPEIDSAVESANFDMDLSDTLDPLDENISQIENNKSTIGSIFAVLGGILFSIGMVAFVGMLLGLICTKRSSSMKETGRTKAGSCGACLLMTSVGLAVFPLFLILLLGSLLMLLGGNVTIVCAPLQDLTVFKRLVDSGLLFGGENLGEKFFNDPSLNLSITNLFKTCQDDGTVYSGLNLASVMNLSTLFKAEEFVPDLNDSVVAEINDTINDISIIDTSSFDDLRSKLDLPNIDTSTGQEIEDELNGIDLEQKSKEISDLADSIPDAQYADQYRTISIGLQELHNDSKVPLLESISNLSTILDKLNSTSQSIKVIITDLSDDLGNLTSYVQNDAANVVVLALNDFLAGMTTVPDTLIGSVTDALSTDIGRCKVLSDVYEIVVGSFCTHFLDSFNVLWASFYTSGLLCIVLMISSCTLSKYFRIPDDDGAYRQQRQNITYNAQSSPSSANVDLIYYKKNTEGSNTSNNASFNRVNYHKIHQKWRNRRRLITGPLTAQFFANNAVWNLSTAQTSFMTNTKLDVSANIPFCTVVDLDDSTNDSAWSSQSLQSFKDTSSQDTLNSNDEDEKITDPCKNDCSAIVHKEESVFRSPKDLKIPEEFSNQCAKSMDKSKDGKQHASKITSFPYFQLEGDEFILLPMTKLTTESLEGIDQSAVGIEDDSQQHLVTTKLEQEISKTNESNRINELESQVCKGKESSGVDRWLSSYRIESNTEQNASSPLVKYSSENGIGTQINQSFKTKKCHDPNTAAKKTVLNYDNKDLDDDSHMKEGRNDEVNVSKNNEIDNSHGDGSNNSLECQTRNSLLYSRNKSSIDETEYPVQQVICALCKTVGVRSRKYGNPGTMRVDSTSSNATVEAKNDKLRRDINIIENNVRKTNDTYISNFGTEDEIVQLNKSLENSFRTFDDTLENLTGERTCDQKEREMNCENKHVETKNINVNQHKLDLKVKPYKPLKKTLSPQAAFHFWKYIEANCTCSDDSNTLPRRGEHNIAADMHTPDYRQTNAKYYCQNALTENMEASSEIEQNEQMKDIGVNGPESLVNLAINAGRLAYIPQGEDLMEARRKDQNMFNDGQKQVHVPRCEVASTRKDNVRVSYV